MRKCILALLAIIMVNSSCKEFHNAKENEELLPIDGNLLVVADTITVDVTLRALDTTSIWDIEQHKYVNQKVLIDHVFNDIYQDRVKTYDFFSGEELSKRDVKKIENSDGYSRDLISKIQYKEFWYIDSTGTLKKQVLSYTLGMEITSEKGTHLGHKALFTVKPKQ